MSKIFLLFNAPYIFGGVLLCFAIGNQYNFLFYAGI